MNNLNILYEDNHLIIVVKPSNIPVQKDASQDIDLLTMIKNYIKEKYQKPGNVYLSLVHRLDRPVGGIMVFAKTSKAASRLSNMIKNHEFKKSYLAIVHGKVKNKETLKAKISKDEHTHSSYIDTKNGKESILHYERVAYKDNLSLIKVSLITGRHHQIRLQLASIAHPLYGDNRYGLKEQVPICLFAYALEFFHPIKKELMQFKVLPPMENKWTLFKNYLNNL